MKSILAGSAMLAAVLIIAQPAHAQYGGGGTPAVVGSIIGGGGPVTSAGGGLPSVPAPPNPANASIVPQGQVLGAQAYRFTADLHLGSTGADVRALQQFLIAGGYSIPAGPTGYFGSQTKAAVIAYQKANRIAPAAGYVGPITIALLNRGETPTPADEKEAKAESLVTSTIATLATIGLQVSLTSQQKLAAALAAVNGLINALKAL